MTDTATLDDLVTFARLEVAANEIEPWAAVLAELRRNGDLADEPALWAVKLYNAYDDFGSAFRVYAGCPDPQAWPWADPSLAVAQPLSQERRSLRGGRIVRHLDSYAGLLDGTPQRAWLEAALPAGADPQAAFPALDARLRDVWGVGRQTSFEWAEFAAKVAGLPVDTPDGALWESSGPRESIERIYEAEHPDVGWLNARAGECKATLAAEGVDLSWWDFETVICDFNVMRKGRYYVGQHLAMIREEIESLDDLTRGMLDRAYAAVIPEPWATGVKAGVDKELRRRYRDTRQIVIPMEEAA